MKEVVDSETGEVKLEKVQGEPVDSLYKVRFDKYSTAWEKDKFQNESTLKGEESWANDVLRLQGYLFLNDVYDRLGLPRTKHGQIVPRLCETVEEKKLAVLSKSILRASCHTSWRAESINKGERRKIFCLFFIGGNLHAVCVSQHSNSIRYRAS